jgi:CheY-like chemotaxis protein
MCVIQPTDHDRNPLSATLICADDIRDTLTQHKFQPEDQQVVGECIEAAKNIVLCVQHQKSIVDDILTVSKLDSKLLRTTPVPAQPISVVKHAMTMFYPECQAKGIEFRFAPHPCLKLYNIDWVLLDPTRLLQITINLITNAIKFTQHSTKRSIIVHLSVSPEHPELYKSYDYIPKRGLHNDVAAGEDWGSGQVLYIHVDVEDSGCGLTDEEKAVLFEKFAQASPRTHVTYGGSGLGLYISRQLAELHGGQIGVSSKAGVGSTFGFFLKCQRLPSGGNRLSVSRRESANSIVEAALDLHPAIFDALLLPNSTNLNILLVEDNLVNQRVLKKQLTKAGCTITTADNGLYALDHLTTTRFQTASTDGLPLDIILMDWEMPEMDGLTCCKKIREMEKSGELNAHVPILGVTANVRSEQISIAKENGMDDILPKPFRVPELLEKIRCVLRRLEDGGGLEDRMSSGELEHGR